MNREVARRALAADRDESVALIDTMSSRLRAVVDAGADASSDDEHDPEGSTLAFERGQLLAQIERSKMRVVEIDAAQIRVEAGTYGVCENCGTEISDARLEALPAARLCFTCASSGGSSRRW